MTSLNEITPDLPQLEKGESLLDHGNGNHPKRLSRIDIPRPYNDRFFAIAFVIQTLTIVGVAISLGSKALYSEGPTSITIKADQSEILDSSGEASQLKLLGGIFVIVFLGGCMSIGWVSVMTQLSYKLITFSFLAIIMICVISGITFFTSGVIFAGVCLLLLGLLMSILFIYLRPRMKLASATLKIACESVKALPATIYFSIAILAVQIVYCIVWTLAVLGVATNESKTTISSHGRTFSLDECATYTYSSDFLVDGQTLQCPTGESCTSCICDGSTVVSQQPCFSAKINGGMYFLLLISLYWACNVFANVVHCTTSGAVYTWWCSLRYSGSAAVKASFKNAVTSSFGSICLGSLLVAVLKAVRTMFNFTMDKVKRLDSSRGHLIKLFVIRCLETLLRLLDRIMVYFNRYAFCYVAMYGYSFLESSKEVMSLFSERGFTAMINDDIIEIILSLGHLVVALLCTMVGYWYGVSVHMGVANTTILTLLGFFGGYMMCAVTMKVVSAAVATVYVCFAEAPDELESAHPELYLEMTAAWRELYPLSGHDSDPAAASRVETGTAAGTYRPPSGRGGAAAGAAGAATVAAYSSLPVADDDEADTIVSFGSVGTVGSSSGSSAAQSPYTPYTPYGSPQKGASSSGLLKSVGTGAQVVYEEFSKLFANSTSSDPGAFSAGDSSPRGSDGRFLGHAGEWSPPSAGLLVAAGNGSTSAVNAATAPPLVVGRGEDDEETVTF